MWRSVGLIPKGERGGIWNQPSVVGLEGGDIDYQLPLRLLRLLPRHPPWFTGGSQHRYHLPRGQTASAFKVREGGFSVRNISVPSQGI